MKSHGGVGGRASVENSDIATLGKATVTAVAAFPDIHEGPGRLVTSVYRHGSRPVLDLRVEGEPRPIVVTGNHPVWSEDRDDFVRVDVPHVGGCLANARVASVSTSGAEVTGPS